MILNLKVLMVKLLKWIEYKNNVIIVVNVASRCGYTTI